MTTANRKLDIELETMEQVPESNEWAKTLPKLLRSLGAIAILLSLYSFLMRGWEGGDDLLRYSMLLGHTGLLTMIALMSGHFLKEGKGARVLLMLSLVSTVVNYAVLGAFIFAGLGLATGLNLPMYVTWSVGSLNTALLLTALATCVLIPITWFGFRSLVRVLSTRMTVLFILSNLALLLPFRDPLLVAGITIILGLYTLFITAKTAREHAEVKTLEGRVALLLQFLPIGVLLGRNIWLYSPEFTLFTALCFVIFIAIRQCSLLMRRESFWRTLMEVGSVSLAMGAGLNICNALFAMGLHQSAALIIGTLMTAGMCYEISMRASSGRDFYRIIATAIATIGLVSNLMIYGGALASLITLGVGIAAIAVSYTVQQRAIFIGGVIMVITSLIDQALHFIQVFDFSYWISLAISGVVAIVIASLLESKGSAIKQRLIRWKNSYSDWSY